MPAPRVRGSGESPKLVIVIDDLGASASAIQALLKLEYPVTFAFWPHGANTRAGAEAAHAANREIIIHQPMEPLGYPQVKPGPGVLLVGMGESDIRSTLKAAFAAVPHAVGLNNHMGSRFTQNAEGTAAVAKFVKERGLFILDSLTHSGSVFANAGKRAGVPRHTRSVFLDVRHSREQVLAELKRAEKIALVTGEAIAIGHPLPGTLEALEDWQRMRNKSVRIVKLKDLRNK